MYSNQANTESQQFEDTKDAYSSGLTATYSPEDNKLRLYSMSRLDNATYKRVSAAGFKYAPKQGFFVAPMWTTAREDLLIELCGEIGDEDSSLVDRAKDRAERFSSYRENRANDAESARNAVSAIASGIPFGQPILIGHHSEKRARKDAERIENGMRRAVQMWETADYWKRRAAGALRHAKYKQLPDVRHRRIKTLEAEKRKHERFVAECNKWLTAWSKEGLSHDEAIDIANYCRLDLPRKEGDKPDFTGSQSACGALTNSYPNLYAPRTLAEVVEHAKAAYPRTIAHYGRWIAHYEHRISYERAMLEENGGIVGEKNNIEIGGQVLIGSEWLTVLRVNKKDGEIKSVTTNARFVRVRGIEEIDDYRAPTADDTERVKKATKLPTLANFPGDGFLEMTAAEYKRIHSDFKATRTINKTEAHGAYRYRAIYRVNAGYRALQVFITDAKRVDPPKQAPESKADEPAKIPQTERIAHRPIVKAQPDKNEFDAMREQLREGVKVVSAPQLFPTPRNLAVRMVALANPQPGQSVLEPSAGTGRILTAIRQHCPSTIRTAVEVSQTLCRQLERGDPGAYVFHADFLEWKRGTQTLFDAIVMNPPFIDGSDIKHIKHALNMLKPGGRLVAVCANGPRQNAQLRPLVEQHGGEWEDLPPGTFLESGTGVNTALISLTVY